MGRVEHMKFEVIDIATTAETMSKKTNDILNCSDPWFYPNCICDEDDYQETDIESLEEEYCGSR